MSKPAARQGDSHDCAERDHGTGHIKEGSPNVFIEGMPAARKGDKIHCHAGANTCITEGSATVFFNGNPAARVGDASDHDGNISTGASGVFIGSGGSPVHVGDLGQIHMGPNVYIGGLQVGPAKQPSITAAIPSTQKLTDITIRYVTAAHKPIANAYYTVVFTNGAERSGRLDSQGKAQLTGVPALDYTVTYSTRAAEDTKPGVYESLQNKLATQRESLQQYLDEILQSVKQSSVTKQQLFEHENFINKGLILTGAVLTDAWDIGKQTVNGLIDLTKDGAKLAFDFGIIALGDPQDPAVQQQAQELKDKSEELIHVGEEDSQLFWWAVTDSQIRQMFYDFAVKYWHTLDIVDKVKETGYAPLFLLMMILLKRFKLPATGEATSAFANASLKLKHIATTLERLAAISVDDGLAEKDLTTTLPKSTVTLLPMGYYEEFSEGASLLMTRLAYERWVVSEDILGRPDGLFVVSKKAMDALLAKTGGDIKQIQEALGTDDWEDGGGLIRIDIPDPFKYNPRLPKGTEAGANQHFVAGGQTKGGQHELVIDQLQGKEIKQTKITSIYTH